MAESDTRSDELKPCPFCGGAVEMHYTGSSDWEVVCKGDCQVETRFWISAPKFGYGAGETNEAVRRWNARAPVSEQGRSEFIRAFLFWYHRDGSVGGLSQVVEEHADELRPYESNQRYTP